MSDSNTDINAELFNAVKNNEIDRVKNLISKGADVNAYDGSQSNSLYYAVKNDFPDIAKVLLDNGAEFIIPIPNVGRERRVQDRYQKIEDEHCKNSLHLAARLGKLEEVKNLLRKGAKVDAKNDKGQTPFDLAVDKEIKDLLQSVKEANDKLLEAAKSGNIGDIENLLNEEGKAQVNATDQDGWTPLHWAALYGKEKVVEVLLKVKEINVNATDQYGGTPLHLAAANGHKDVVEFLLNKEADVNAKDKDGKTPLHLAALSGKEEVAALLLNKEADVNAVNKYGWTPLHWAALYGKEKVVEVLLKVEEINVNATDQDGKTPLHWAAEKGHKEVVEVLLKVEGINVNAVDEDGSTPFDLAGTEEIETLLQNAEKTDPVDESSTDSKGDQEEDAGTQQKEKQEGNAQPGSDIAEKGTGVSNDSQPTGPTQNNGGQPTTSAGQGADVQNKGVNPVASTEPAQTEEQPSSFFGSLFSILMKPFSLIASFFGGFFSWLFGSNEEKADESISQPDDDVSLPTSSSLDDSSYDTMNPSE